MLQHYNIIPIQPKRVIILGSSGFIGSALYAYLETLSCLVIPLASKDLDLASPDAAQSLAKLIQPNDVIVFLSVIGPNRGHDTAAFINNLRMAENVGNALQKSPCAQIMYISSEAVYGSQAEFISASTIPTPDTLYGVMHLSRELILKQMLGALVPLLILRTNQVYGPGCTHNAYGPNRFVRSAQQLHNIDLFGQGEELRDFIYIGDVISIITAAIYNKSVGVTNLATGNSITYMYLAQQVQQVQEVLGAMQVPITSKQRMQPITHRQYNINDLYAAFPGLSFTILCDGLRQTLMPERLYA